MWYSMSSRHYYVNTEGWCEIGVLVIQGSVWYWGSDLRIFVFWVRVCPWIPILDPQLAMGKIQMCRGADVAKT